MQQHPQQQLASHGGSEEDDSDSREFALSMARIAWETKAEDLLVLHVAPLAFWTCYMVICTVSSRPQLNAVLAKMEKEASDAYGRQLSRKPQAG